MWRRLIYHPEVNYALRQTLVLCLPVAIGLILGHLQQGLLFSLVPACCNIAGLDTPHKRFFKRLIIGGCLFAGCSLAVQLLLARKFAARPPASRVADCGHLHAESRREYAGVGAAADLRPGDAVVRAV